MRVLGIIALMWPGALTILQGAATTGRTLHSSESSRLFGGADDDNNKGRECGVVQDCLAANACGNVKDFDGSPGDCTEKVETQPVQGAGRKACNKVIPDEVGKPEAEQSDCYEGQNQDCSKRFECDIDPDANVCYRTSNEKNTRGRAPSGCGPLPVMPIIKP